jgi:GNAT superfamily N-acetyltransferase
MTANLTKQPSSVKPAVPDIPGVKLRRYRGHSDLSVLASVITCSRGADGVVYVTTTEDLASEFENPKDFDPSADVLIVEAEGKIVGVSRISLRKRKNSLNAFNHSVELLAPWRGKGIRERLFEYNEAYVRAMAGEEGAGCRNVMELWAGDHDNEWKSMIVSRGYHPVQHVIDMVRSLDDIPDMPLPEGFEIHPVKPEHYPEIIQADRDSSAQDWDFREEDWTEEKFYKFLKSTGSRPELWQVAWKGDTLAGMVLNYIQDEENRGRSRKRGHTEHVSVREQFRGRGLARALLASSFRVLKENGMDDAVLGMEVENPHDPLRLYQGMGFQIEQHLTWYQKPVD